jgi:hypothetical protein
MQIEGTILALDQGGTGRCAGLDHGIGHLACMSPQKNERLTFSKG